MVICLCCSPRPGPLPSMAPGKSINPPIGDCNHISSDSLVPLGWRCGCHQQAALQCQTTDSTPTWLTAVGSAFPFCHEKEKTLECPSSARCHGPRPVVLKQGMVLPAPPQPTSADIYDCHHSREGQGRPGMWLGTPQGAGQPPPHRERAGLERLKCRGRETLSRVRRSPSQPCQSQDRNISNFPNFDTNSGEKCCLAMTLKKKN